MANRRGNNKGKAGGYQEGHFTREIDLLLFDLPGTEFDI
jgi:hypothetical protein